MLSTVAIRRSLLPLDFYPAIRYCKEVNLDASWGVFFLSMNPEQLDAVQQAMTRRGLQMPSNASVTPPQLPQAPVNQQTTPAPATEEVNPSSPQSGEAMIILKAMANRLKMLGEMGV